MPEKSELQRFIERRMAGESDPESAADPAAYGPGGVGFIPPDPVHAELLRRALAAEIAAEAGDDADEQEPATEYDPGSLGAFAAAAAAAMGFEPRSEEPATGQERFFAALGEDGQDTLWAAWLAGLSAEDRAGVLAGDSEAVASFEEYVQASALSTAANVADGIPGARLVRDRLHRPLRRFRR